LCAAVADEFIDGSGYKARGIPKFAIWFFCHRRRFHCGILSGRSLLASTIATGHDAEAVVLYFMNPTPPGRGGVDPRATGATEGSRSSGSLAIRPSPQ